MDKVLAGAEGRDIPKFIITSGVEGRLGAEDLPKDPISVTPGELQESIGGSNLLRTIGRSLSGFLGLVFPAFLKALELSCIVPPSPNSSIAKSAKTLAKLIDGMVDHGCFVSCNEKKVWSNENKIELGFANLCRSLRGMCGWLPKYAQGLAPLPYT